MRTFSLLCLLCISTNVFAQFSGKGSGTETDPYQVSNSDELFEVRNDLSANYVQTADIDLTQFIEEDNPNIGWSPIGTESTPFKGSYNGNGYSIRGLYINRTTTNYVGLFGYVWEAKISSLVIVSPNIRGNDYVGTLVGYGFCSLTEITVLNPILESANILGGVIGQMSYPTSSMDAEISSCVLLNGYLKGVNYSGGLVGISKAPSYKCMIARNYVNSYIEGNKCGGIIGQGDTYYYNHSRELELVDNRFSGTIHAGILAGGIIAENLKTANSSYAYAYINRNIVSGSIYSTQTSAGIVAYDEKTDVQRSNNVVVLDTLVGNPVYRITDNPVNSNNLASSSMTVLSNGKPLTIEDNGNNGISYGLKVLKKRTTYEGLGFDFSNIWNMVDGETFPYPKNMTSPCAITSFQTGSKSIIEGNAKDANKVYVFINGNLYESYVVDGKWSVSLGNIKKGTKASVSVKAEGKQPSICIEAIAEGETVTDDVLLGDSNGDGAVDAADVVSIINYILGKPSSSFNNKNADANDDGQILVDDAVGTVNIIMNEQ